MLALVTRWNHNCLHVMSVHIMCVAHKSHLLRVQRLLLVYLTRLNSHSLILNMLVAHSIVRLCLASFSRLLLSEAHILRLHHVRRHA